MNRHFQRCRCKYQLEHPWGYSVFIRDEKTYWRGAHIEPSPSEACRSSEPYTVVLIICRGCGQEMIREYDKPLA